MSNNKDFKVKNGIQPTVYHEGLGTVVSGSEGYYLAGASYDSVSFLSSGQGTHATGLSFKPDGTKMYILNATNDSVYQYTLSTAWDVSTASYDSVSFSITSQDTEAYDLHFKTDGTKFYVAGYNSNTVYQYSLSTSWDLSTASYDSVSFSVSSQENQLTSIYFKTDGTKLYAVGITNDTVYQYTLSTAWNVSTASYDSVSFSVGAQETFPASLEFNSDGSTLFVIGGIGRDVNYYTLSTAWDVSTASYTGVFDTSSQGTNPQDIFFKPDGTKMYLAARSTNRVYQYSTVLSTAQLDLSTGSVFDYTPTSDVQVTLSNPSDSGTVSGATLLLGSEDAAGVASTFSTTLYTGTGAAKTITNGIDLAGDGGMVWVKSRASGSHSVWDSERGINYWLSPDNGTGQIDYSATAMVSFNTDGFTLGSDNVTNRSATNHVAWTFKKQSSFFDIVTYTGNGVAGREIAHNLGSTPAVIITKNLNDTENWQVYHKDLGNDQRILLNQAAASGSAPTHWNSTTPTDTVFTVGTHNGTNGSGDGIVAYLFAHDTDASSIIKCGSYTTDGSEEATIDLGFEPQWVLFKRTDSSTGGDWNLFDTMRGITADTSGDGAKLLEPNTSDAELATSRIAVTPTGFKVDNYGANRDFIYIAIRAENIPTITYDPTLEWPGGTAPTAPAKGETDVLTFNTRDGGTTYSAVQAIDGAK